MGCGTARRGRLFCTEEISARFEPETLHKLKGINTMEEWEIITEEESIKIHNAIRTLVEYTRKIEYSPKRGEFKYSDGEDHGCFWKINVLLVSEIGEQTKKDPAKSLDNW